MLGALRDFRDVDQAAGPSMCIQYLDTLGARPDVRAYKELVRELLALRPKSQVLEVGCGTGVDALSVAACLGPGGRVVGLDRSSRMIEAARKRAAGQELAAEFCVADAHQLPFPDCTFSVCFADRTFQHLLDPRAALEDLSRVACSGGRIVVSEPDWTSLTVEGGEAAATEIVLAQVRAEFHRPEIGRQLAELFHLAELTEISTETVTARLTSYREADVMWGLMQAIRRAREAGELSLAEATHWPEELARASDEGCFSSTLTLYIVSGQKCY